MSVNIGSMRGVWTSGGGGQALEPGQPIPMLGSELLTNGNMESGSPPSSWVSSSSVLTSVADERAGGAGAAAIDVQNNGAVFGQGQQAMSPVALNAWFLMSGFLRRVTVDARLRVQRTSSPFTVYLESPQISSTSWVQAFAVGRAGTTNMTARLVNVTNTNNASARFDDVSVRPLTLSSLFGTPYAYGKHRITKANAIIVAGTRAGVVSNLDSASSPANFVLATHDGITARLTKCVGGAYTELISVTTTYVAGAAIEIRRALSTNTFQLFYNSVQVGTDQTIGDAGIIDNVLGGYFNTYAGNTLYGFSSTQSS